MPDEQENQNEINDWRKRQAELMQREMQLREVLRKILDEKAFERLSNIRLANTELYAQIAQMLIYAYQQGQIQGKVTEEVLVKLLNRLKAGEKEPTITFKRK